MKESQEIINERRRDAEREAAFNAKLEGLREAAITEASRKYESLNQRLSALLSAKTALQRGPLCREEVLELAKAALKKEQIGFSLESLLSKHFETCMKRENIPLNPDFLKSQFFTPADFYRVIYWLLSNKTLEAAAVGLPSGGLGKREREAQIMAIDAEISELEGQIEKMVGEEK